MYHFDIPKTRQYDNGKIEVIARSSVGEALATTDLNIVQRKDDYRGVLKNSPRRKYSHVMLIEFSLGFVGKTCTYFLHFLHLHTLLLYISKGITNHFFLHDTTHYAFFSGR